MAPCPLPARASSSGKFPEVPGSRHRAVPLARAGVEARPRSLGLGRVSRRAPGKAGRPRAPAAAALAGQAQQKARHAPAAARQGRPSPACSVAPCAFLRLAGAPAGSTRGGAQSRRLAAPVEWRLIQLNEGSLICMNAQPLNEPSAIARRGSAASLPPRGFGAWHARSAGRLTRRPARARARARSRRQTG